MKKVVSVVCGALVGFSAFAAKNKVQDDGVINYLNEGAAISSGALIKVGDQYGVALADIASNETGAVAVEGVFRFSVANATATFGTKMFYSSASTVTTTAGNGTYVGAAVQKIATNATTVNVYLNAPVNEDVGGVTSNLTLYTVAAGSANAITNVITVTKGSVTTVTP